MMCGSIYVFYTQPFVDNFAAFKVSSNSDQLLSSEDAVKMQMSRACKSHVFDVNWI